MNALGGLIDAHAFLAAEHRPRYATFVNPSFEKGVGMVARLALMCRERLIAARHGGLRESLNSGGVVLDVPVDARARHDQLIGEAAAQPWYDVLAALWSDADAYSAASERARDAGQTHDLKAAVGRFLAAHLEKTR